MNAMNLLYPTSYKTCKTCWSYNLRQQANKSGIATTKTINDIMSTYVRSVPFVFLLSISVEIQIRGLVCAMLLIPRLLPRMICTYCRTIINFLGTYESKIR